MAVEAKRGCGYRKVGGLYLVGEKLSGTCGRLPLELHVCPTCHGGIKQTRGWTWVRPVELLAAAPPCSRPALPDLRPACLGCPLATANLHRLGEQAGLLWVGGSFYPEAADYMQEAAHMGVSRRIAAVPRGFRLGEHWVLIAHPRAVLRAPRTPDELAEVEQECVPGMGGQPLVRKGIITVFKPTALEKIVTESEAHDRKAMRALAEKGITPVAVPDDDADHQGTVYDGDEEATSARQGAQRLQSARRVH